MPTQEGLEREKVVEAEVQKLERDKVVETEVQNTNPIIANAEKLLFTYSETLKEMKNILSKQDEIIKALVDEINKKNEEHIQKLLSGFKKVDTELIIVNKSISINSSKELLEDLKNSITEKKNKLEIINKDFQNSEYFYRAVRYI